jgi:mRNA interferase MazF
MTRDTGIAGLAEVFVMLATTTIRGLPTEVELGQRDGMPRTCVLNADHTDTLAKGFLIERITKLSQERMSEVCSALAHATSC